MSLKKLRVAGVGNKSLIASLVTLAMGLIPDVGLAAGLGRLTITSAIGQPLVGEIELVSVSKEELSSLGARIATPDAYRNANIQFNPALVGARASVERRSGGQPYIRVTSSRPIDEPYLDLLVELTWSTGRLVREYTALIDPPGFGPAQTATPVAVPSAPAAPAAPIAAPPAAPARPSAPAGADAGAKTYGPVQPGDTLRKIAAGVRPQGVSLDQVLVGIFRSNPDAFINNNMNLLRSGKILRIPEASELGQIAAGDAGNEVRVQSSDWNAYRQRAAGAVPEVPAGESRAAAGKITTRVDDAAQAQTPSKEVVKISKGAPGKDAAVGEKGMQDRIRVLEEEATAREKTLKDSSDRIASLEKTIKDMQRLLELKGALPPGVKPEAAAPPAEKPAAAPPAEKPAVTEPPPAEKPAVVAEVKPEVKPQPEAKPQPKPIAPPPPPPAAQWWEDPTILGGGLVGLGVLGGAGYLLARRRRQEVAAPEEPIRRPPIAAAAPAAAAAAVAEPVATATAEVPAAPAAAPAPSDDVDPIAEADVYIAYGRDAQAEEILKEALAKNPGRQEIKLKLLEIYAARKSKNDFNPLAAELHDATQGRGDLWLKAATMGFALDPDNALYAAGKDSNILAPIGMQTDVNLDFDLDMVTSAGAPTTVTDVPLDAGTGDQNVKTMVLSPERMETLQAEAAAIAAAKAAETQSMVVPDLDLSTQSLSAPQTDITLEPASMAGPITDINLDIPASATNSNVIDFEFDPSKTVRVEPAAAAGFGHDQTVAISPENQAQARDLGVEIDLGALDAPPTQTIVPEDTAVPPVAEPTADISFDFQLPAEAPPTVADLTVPPTDIKLDVPELKPADNAAIDFALDTVSFDLGSQQVREAPAPQPVHDDHWYDVQTKFDLAKAYQEMGDKDGAREILAEVIKEGDDQQKAEAQDLLGKLG